MTVLVATTASDRERKCDFTFEIRSAKDATVCQASQAMLRQGLNWRQRAVETERWASSTQSGLQGVHSDWHCTRGSGHARGGTCSNWIRA